MPFRTTNILRNSILCCVFLWLVLSLIFKTIVDRKDNGYCPHYRVEGTSAIISDFWSKRLEPMPPDLQNYIFDPAVLHWMNDTEREAIISSLQINVTDITRLKQLCVGEVTVNMNASESSLCPCYASSFTGHVKINTNPPTWREMMSLFGEKGIEAGGHYTPTKCQPRQRVAIIIPYRAREHHLQVLLNHLHTHLPKHNLEYRIFVVEQAYPNIFNRGALINLGYLVASKNYAFDCVMPHDVDLLLEDDRIMYACYKMPRHMSGHNDKHLYKRPPKNHFGGLTAISKSVFERANGYPNSYWGWGGEDDDMSARLQALGLTIFRHPLNVEHFTLLKHERHKLNPYNVHKSQYVRPSRDELIISRDFNRSVNMDGLSNLDLNIYGIQERPLYTWVFAEILSPLSNFTVKEGGCIEVSKRNSQKMKIMSCARFCSNSDKCRWFVFFYDKSWQSYCFTHANISDKCTFVAMDNTYVYLKAYHFPKNEKIHDT